MQYTNRQILFVDDELSPECLTGHLKISLTIQTLLSKVRKCIKASQLKPESCIYKAA